MFSPPDGLIGQFSFVCPKARYRANGTTPNPREWLARKKTLQGRTSTSWPREARRWVLIVVMLDARRHNTLGVPQGWPIRKKRSLGGLESSQNFEFAEVAGFKRLDPDNELSLLKETTR